MAGKIMKRKEANTISLTAHSQISQINKVPDDFDEGLKE